MNDYHHCPQCDEVFHNPEFRRVRCQSCEALAAATGTAKTPKAVECEASQSGAAKTAQRPTSGSSDKERE